MGPCKGQKRKIERIPEAQTAAGLADLGGLFLFVVTFGWEVLFDSTERGFPPGNHWRNSLQNRINIKIRAHSECCCLTRCLSGNKGVVIKE